MTSEIKRLTNICQSGEPEQQIASIEALVELNATNAIPTFLLLFASPDPVVRFTAIQAVSELAVEAELVGPALLRLLNDGEDIVRSEAIDALGRLCYEPALAAVQTALLQDSSALVRASAAETLGDLGEPVALQSLECALQDSDESVRAYAANSCGLLADAAEINALARHLQSEPSSRVRAEILGAQYRLGSSNALIAFLELIETSDDDLAPSLLNIVDDWLYRNTPIGLANDVIQLHQGLRALAQRLPLQQSHVDILTTQLQTITLAG
ncbi:MAG: HEAT repeat domain-containing protein [Cyanothece sp. SIO2G6]|nr:HEAT repeat domain-containing protein [Cyanothece sp. SIO2G6]